MDWNEANDFVKKHLTIIVAFLLLWIAVILIYAGMYTQHIIVIS